MIISASRRTDIPAYYARWFMNRIRAGFCDVPNPFNRHQVTRVSLRPEDVDAIVFWTRDARPLMSWLDELDARGYRYVFLVTVLDYPPPLRAHDLPAPAAVRMFGELAARLGPERVVWRYDPLVFSAATNGPFHAAKFAALAESLRGFTRRVIVSGLSRYRKNRLALASLAQGRFAVVPKEQVPPAEMESLLRALATTAQTHGLELVSCAETMNWRDFGIAPGRCLDHVLLQRACGVHVAGTKDHAQRPACGCVVSRDIGTYNTCVRGCPYCYAVANPELARRALAQHDPEATALLAGPPVAAAEARRDTG